MAAIAEPAKFLRELGGLHDCAIVDATFDPEGRSLSLSIDDLNWNTEGMPEYPGPRPGRLVFIGTDAADAIVQALRGIWISELTVASKGEAFDANLLAASGQTTAWAFRSLRLIEP